MFLISSFLANTKRMYTVYEKESDTVGYDLPIWSILYTAT